jgi:hypothetical protein
MRKMKKAAKLGASAVPMLHPRKRTAVVQVIYTCAEIVSTTVPILIETNLKVY